MQAVALGGRPLKRETGIAGEEGDGRRRTGRTYKEIALQFGLTEYHMENCPEIVRLIEAAGLMALYCRLTEKPDHVPQWASEHWLKAGNRKSGGCRRKAS